MTVDGGLLAADGSSEPQSDSLLPAHSPPVIHVVAGALLQDGRVLIAQRPPGKHMAGGWEFPGGKLANGESSRAALLRELREELGVEVTQCEFVARCAHDYPDRRVHLELWRVTGFTGEPQSLDGQALRWVSLNELPQAGLLPADAPLVAALLNTCSGRFQTGRPCAGHPVGGWV